MDCWAKWVPKGGPCSKFTIKVFNCDILTLPLWVEVGVVVVMAAVDVDVDDGDTSRVASSRLSKFVLFLKLIIIDK